MNRFFYFCIIFLFSSHSNATDLTGHAIDCEVIDSHRGNKEFFSVEFISKKKAKYSQVQIQNNMNTNYADKVLYLVRNEVVHYQPKENFILIRNKRLKPDGWDHTQIGRDDLWLGGVKGGHVQDLRGDSRGCQLINIKTNDPFKKYDNFKFPSAPKKKKKIL